MWELGIAGLVFSWIILAVWLLVRFAGRRQAQVYERLGQFVSTPSTQQAGAEAPAGRESWRQRLDRAFSRKDLTKYIGGPAQSKQLEQDLIRAGIPMRATEFNLIRIGAVILCFGFGAVIVQNLLLGCLLAGFGYIAPRVYVQLQQQRRLHQFNRQLGDGINMLSNSLKAGYGFLQSLDQLAKELPPPLSTEFAQTLREINLGIATEQALLSMVKRVKSDDLELIVTAVLIQRQTGGNLAEILDNIAFTIRERVKIQGEIKTLTAQGRISGLIIGLLPIILAMVMLAVNPDYLKLLFTNKLGLLMLGVACIAEVIGMLIIKKIITIRI